MTKKMKNIVACCVAGVLVIGGVLGGLWAAGVFDKKDLTMSQIRTAVNTVVGDLVGEQLSVDTNTATLASFNAAQTNNEIAYTAKFNGVDLWVDRPGEGNITKVANKGTILDLTDIQVFEDGNAADMGDFERIEIGTTMMNNSEQKLLVLTYKNIKIQILGRYSTPDDFYSSVGLEPVNNTLVLDEDGRYMVSINISNNPAGSLDQFSTHLTLVLTVGLGGINMPQVETDVLLHYAIPFVFVNLDGIEIGKKYSDEFDGNLGGITGADELKVNAVWVETFNRKIYIYVIFEELNRHNDSWHTKKMRVEINYNFSSGNYTNRMISISKGDYGFGAETNYQFFEVQKQNDVMLKFFHCNADFRDDAQGQTLTDARWYRISEITGNGTKNTAKDTPTTDFTDNEINTLFGNTISATNLLNDMDTVQDVTPYPNTLKILDRFIKDELLALLQD